MDKLWFEDEIYKTEHMKRISNVLDIKQYLLRLHKVLQRPDFQFKEETYKTAKIVLNTLKTIINFHTSYVVGNPVSITGQPEIVKKFNDIYKQGIYTKIDYEIVKELMTYGNAFEYLYLDNKTIKSHIIANEDSYPVYDEQENYTSFVEHWEDMENGHKNYIVYYLDRVETWQDGILKNTAKNLSGLPIHYISMEKSEYNFFGDSPMNDLIPIMNQIEQLLSKLDDAITTLSMNPLGVSMGQRITDSIPKDICGATLNLEDGGDFKYVTAMLDYNNIKLLLESLTQQLYTIAGVPSAVVGQSNVSNVSEISLKLLFSQTDTKARQMIQVLKEGMYKRFEYFRKLLAIQGVSFSDNDMQSIDVTFTVNRPVDTNNLMNELKTQRDMGAISIQSIIEQSPYTVDSATEMQRILSESKV